MATVRTPSTSDYSTLDSKARNDNTTLHNTTTATTVAADANAVPEVPNRGNENEFDVPKHNEVHPGQNHGDMDEDAQQSNEEAKENSDKKKVNPATLPASLNDEGKDKEQRSEDVNTLGNQGGDNGKIELELR